MFQSVSFSTNCYEATGPYLQQAFLNLSAYPLNVGSEMVGKLKIHLRVVKLLKLPELEAVRKCQLVPVPQSWGI